MQATIDSHGDLQILPETPIERYALEQKQICHGCDHRHYRHEHNEEWCYMFQGIFVGCKKFIPLRRYRPGGVPEHLSEENKDTTPGPKRIRLVGERYNKR